MDNVQHHWASLSIKQRLRVLAKAREQIAGDLDPFLHAVKDHPGKSPADMLASEIMPLLAAIRFLEQQAESILRTQKLGSKGMPLWLFGVQSEIQRVPLGKVLVIGPSNYPLLLAGVQTVQALAAGNRVIWKPGRGGQAVAEVFAAALVKAGLPDGLLHITDESVAAAEREIDAGVDKVFFTGSVPSGKALQLRLAKTLTPSVLELSGCDATIVMPGADMSRVVRALAFGMRLNGSATCMAPRRVLLMETSDERKEQFVADLKKAFQEVALTPLPQTIQSQLRSLLEEAEASGATICGQLQGDSVAPILVLNGAPTMRIAQEDLFAPVVTLIDVKDESDVLAMQQACPFGLTASLFGDEVACRKLAGQLEVGAVFINDMILPFADPRLPFGGRRLSGFGVTQGAEGLLEMTAVKTISVRRGGNTKHFDPTTDVHARVFKGLIRTMYTGDWGKRISGIRQVLGSIRGLL